ncbi:hypothetical protein D3C86_1865620 [compost metagenome]
MFIFNYGIAKNIIFLFAYYLAIAIFYDDVARNICFINIQDLTTVVFNNDITENICFLFDGHFCFPITWNQTT